MIDAEHADPSQTPESPAPEFALAGSRHERRKARTRAQITEAASRLFAERGYLETSVDDISEAADVAVRTIYTHFSSKAAILLDYFDRWLDALVDGVIARPAGEPVAESVAAVLQQMTDDGWVDRSYDDLEGSPPSALGLIVGPPEVAGHMVHAWVQAQDRIVAATIARGDYPVGSLEPQARASAIFSACMAPIFAAQAARDGVPLPEGSSANSLIVEFITRLTRGGL